MVPSSFTGVFSFTPLFCWILMTKFFMFKNRQKKKSKWLRKNLSFSYSSMSLLHILKGKQKSIEFFLPKCRSKNGCFFVPNPSLKKGTLGDEIVLIKTSGNGVGGAILVHMKGATTAIQRIKNFGSTIFTGGVSKKPCFSSYVLDFCFEIVAKIDYR